MLYKLFLRLGPILDNINYYHYHQISNSCVILLLRETTLSVFTFLIINNKCYLTPDWPS